MPASRPRKGRMPERIFISPTGSRKKEEHDYVLIAVEEWDELGRPMRARFIGDDEVVNVGEAASAGVRFITAYVPTVCLMEIPDYRNKKCEQLKRSTKADG
jgi:hypothetical protein